MVIYGNVWVAVLLTLRYYDVNMNSQYVVIGKIEVYTQTQLSIIHINKVTVASLPRFVFFNFHGSSHFNTEYERKQKQNKQNTQCTKNKK